MVVDKPHNHGGAKNKGKATTCIPKRDASISYASMVAGNRKTPMAEELKERINLHWLG